MTFPFVRFAELSLPWQNMATQSARKSEVLDAMGSSYEQNQQLRVRVRRLEEHAKALWDKSS